MNIYSVNNTPPGFYVYAYLNENGTPYYIGKGKNKRAWSKIHNVSIPQDNNKIIIIEKNLTDIGALALERRLIKWYGREDENSGILKNRTDGGDGVTLFGNKNGMYGTKRFGDKNPFYGKKHNEQTISKIKEARAKQIIIHSEETKNKIRESRKKTKKIECYYCNKLADPGNFKQFHGDNCKMKVII
jgi:hypothetical protein